MYFKINAEENKIGILSEEVGTGLILGESGVRSGVNEEDVRSGTVWIPATKEQIYEMNKRKVAIELGITCSGFDTKTVSEEDRMLAEMRSYPHSHPACWGLFMTPGGRTYRMACSSREMHSMIEEYEFEQKYRGLLIKEGYFSLPYEEEDPLADFLYEQLRLNAECGQEDDEIAEMVVRNGEQFRNEFFDEVEGYITTKQQVTNKLLKEGDEVSTDEMTYRITSLLGLRDYEEGTGAVAEFQVERVEVIESQAKDGTEYSFERL